MREIKFRAWYNGGYWAVSQITWVFSCFRGQMVYSSLCLSRRRSGVPEEQHWPRLEAVTLEQFTGLRDASGMEIYEGDIIEWGGLYLDPGPWRYQIVWQDGHFVARDLQDGALQNIKQLLELSRTRVIGNIYENPELLEAQNE